MGYRMTDKLQRSLQSLRDKISGIKHQIDQLDSAMIPREDASRAIDKLIEENINRGRPPVRSLAFGNRIPYMIGNQNDGVLHFITWLDPELVRTRLNAELDAVYDVARDVAVAPQDRGPEMKRLAESLFALEVEEERLILSAEDQGVFLQRRGDADPAAILEA